MSTGQNILMILVVISLLSCISKELDSLLLVLLLSNLHLFLVNFLYVMVVYFYLYFIRLMHVCVVSILLLIYFCNRVGISAHTLTMFVGMMFIKFLRPQFNRNIKMEELSCTCFS